MEPRLFHGDPVLVHPYKPVRPGDLVIFVFKDGPNEDEYAFCKVLVSDRGGTVTVEQYNPRGQRQFPRSALVSMHRVLEMRDMLT